MSKIFQKDITVITLLALISIACILIPSLNKFSAVIVLYVLLLFFLPGYTILTALFPKDTGLFGKIIKGIVISFFIVLLFSSSSKQINISFETFLLTLAVLSIFLALIGYIRRFISLKKPKNEYIICEDCEGYYKLEKGESLDDFDACHCGGNLKYAEKNFLSKNESPKKHSSKKSASKSKANEYIVCEKCNGHYRLKEGETLEDFEVCHCGGELKYAKKHFNPKTLKKNSKFRKFSKINLLVVVLALLAIIAVSIPLISNSILRLIFITPLLVFLPGYALTKVLFHYLSRFKLIISSFILSALITFSLGLLFSNFLKVPQITCIVVLAGFTVILTIISYIRDSKVATTKKYSKIQETESKTFKIKETKSSSAKNLKVIPSDILLIWFITAICLVFILTPKLNAFKIIPGILLILFIPGYLLIASLYPRKGSLDNIERFALSFGLSITLTALIGLILKFNNYGTQLTPILLYLSLLTFLFGFLAYVRNLRIPIDERFTLKFKKHYKNVMSSFKGESKISRLLSVILIASIILSISATIYIIITPQQGEKFTEFYILGPKGKASDYPTNLTAGEMGNVTIGIVNHEYASVKYNMIIKLNNQTIDNENITLSSNQTYEKPFTFTASSSGQKQELEFILYKLPDDKNVYRSLHLWINVI